MALKRFQLIVLVFAAAVAAEPAHAVDSRIEKAKKIRDEILEKRRGQAAGAAVRPDVAPENNPFQASVLAARERLAAIDARIEEKRRQSEQAAAPRDKLQARSDELALQVNAIQEQNRARVEAIYRSAKLGAGAAGWHPEPARSARLSRYLASIADVQQKKLELVEIEHGSIIASLDKARAEDVSARGELHALEADRTEALASLDRAMVDAGAPRIADLTPEEAEAEALAQEHAAAMAGTPSPSADPAAESALAVERAMALLQARTGRKPGGEPAPREEGAGLPPGEELAAARGGATGADADAAAASAGDAGEVATTGDFTWPAAAGSDGSKPGTQDSKARADAEAKALAEAKAALEARTAGSAAASEAERKAEEKAAADELAQVKAAETKAAEAKAAEAKAAEAKAAEAKALEAKAAEAKAAEKKAADAKAAEEARLAAEAARPPKVEEDAHGTSGELEDGPPVLAPSAAPAGEQVASVAADPGGEAATNADASGGESEKKRPNLLSRMFGGGDRESDAFAASRGSLPPPVAGKVVANYGQQHKSGGTYRGVILRAGHSAPIKAVAGGKVSFAGNVPGLGNTVIVSHGGRYHTVYARLGSLEVKEGESVGRGAEIGTLPADNADMHFELRDQGKAIDPVPWLKGGVPGAAQ